VNSIRTRLTVAAGAVIVVLTAVAFWLSYAHLQEVAATYGLGNSPIRSWAWPATLDLFIVAGEVMMLVAALAKRKDGWAIGLTVAGSVGSIGLNVYGVGPDAPAIEYIVAAVPPTAALLAFGALMRQIHVAVAAGKDVEVQETPMLAGQVLQVSDEFAEILDEELQHLTAVNDTVDADEDDGPEVECVNEDVPDESVVAVFTPSTKPTLEEINQAVEDLRSDNEPLTGKALAQYFGVSDRSGRRYLKDWEADRAAKRMKAELQPA